MVSLDNVGVVAITDDKYPDQAAFLAVFNLLMDFREKLPDSYQEATETTRVSYARLSECLTKWQDPREVDATIKILFNLKATVEQLYENIDKLLERGEKLDEMKKKIDKLAISANDFPLIIKPKKKSWFSLCSSLC